jgi:undecaprenyl-diphosphatase
MRRLLEIAALGALQGAAELLPVSSSAHVAAVQRLLRWDVTPRQKELEVALHAGAALALAPELLRLLPDARTLALSLAPPVIAGYVWEERFEALGPEVGLVLGAVGLLLADRGGRDDGLRQPGAPPGTGLSITSRALRRRPVPVEPFDALKVGLAQAAALVPGVSRTGATLAAARALGRSRADASKLSFGVAGPVLVGATALKAWRARGAADPALLVGVATSFISARVALKRFGLERTEPWWPYAAERLVLTGALVRYGRRR